MKYAEMKWGTMEAVINKLGGMEGLKRFLRGELVISVAPHFIFFSVKLGTHKYACDYRKALTAEGNNIGRYANDMFGKLPINEHEIELDLVALTVEEFGFKNGAMFEDIYERALEFGLKLCPAEVGLALRLQYQDQPEDEWLIIGMEAITSYAIPQVLAVYRNKEGSRWLDNQWIGSDRLWGPESRFVFVCPK